ncbi:MAG: hypothetical protein LUE92_12920 [Clostridiales bacterium]|nr:hypothetical protein [Clostridiales bacterium]
MSKILAGKRQGNACFVIALVVLFALFAIRQFYGFNKNDEVFYISTVYRFFQGDAMLVDEWNNGQLFTFITYPLYYLTRLVLTSNDGIVLIFRMYYLIFQVMVSVYCHMRLKRFGWARMLPALLYFMTTPCNINNLSYNTLAFGFTLAALVTFAGTEKWGKKDSFLCGIFTAGAVLANPYTIFLFLLYAGVCVVHTIWCRKKTAG